MSENLGKLNAEICFRNSKKKNKFRCININILDFKFRLFTFEHITAAFIDLHMFSTCCFVLFKISWVGLTDFFLFLYNIKFRKLVRMILFYSVTYRKTWVPAKNNKLLVFDFNNVILVLYQYWISSGGSKPFVAENILYLYFGLLILKLFDRHSSLFVFIRFCS